MVWFCVPRRDSISCSPSVCDGLDVRFARPQHRRKIGTTSERSLTLTGSQTVGMSASYCSMICHAVCDHWWRGTYKYRGNTLIRCSGSTRSHSQFAILSELCVLVFCQDRHPALWTGGVRQSDGVKFDVTTPELAVRTVDTRCFPGQKDHSVSDSLVQRYL